MDREKKDENDLSMYKETILNMKLNLIYGAIIACFAVINALAFFTENITAGKLSIIGAFVLLGTAFFAIPFSLIRSLKKVSFKPSFVVVQIVGAVVASILVSIDYFLIK